MEIHEKESLLMNDVNIDFGLINEVVGEIQLQRHGKFLSRSRVDRDEIDDEWNKDRDTIDFVKNSLECANQLTTKMLSTLDVFDQQLESFLFSTDKMRKKTESWKRVHYNIGKSLNVISEVVNNFERVKLVRAEVEKKILIPSLAYYDFDGRKMLENADGNEAEVEEVDERSQGTILDVDTYLYNYNIILELKKYFAQKNFRDARGSLVELNELNAVAMGKIYEYYKNLLRLQSEPVKITCERKIRIYGEPEDREDDAKVGSIEQIIRIDKRGHDFLNGKNIDHYIHNKAFFLVLMPESAVNDLNRLIMNFEYSIANFEYSIDYIEYYMEWRTEFLMESVGGAFSGEGVQGGDGEFVTYRRGWKGRVRTLRVVREEGEEGTRWKREYFYGLEEAYVPGTHLYLVFARVMLVLLRSEKMLCGSILVPGSVKVTFLRSCEKVFAYFIGVGEEVARQHKKSSNRIHSVSVLLDVYETFKELMPYYEEVIGKGNKSYELLKNFYNKLILVCKKQFSKFVEEVRSDQGGSIPSDGIVHEITSTTINFLKHLVYYKTIAADLIPVSLISSPNGVRGLFPGYITNVINELHQNIEYKVKKFDKRSFIGMSTSIISSGNIGGNSGYSSLSNIFLLNNYNFIWKSVKDSDLSREIADDFELKKYHSWVTDQKNEYENFWAKKMNQILQHTKKHTKPEKIMKARIKKFNSEIGELLGEQTKYFIADEELRFSIRKILTNAILVPYKAFLAEYNTLDFKKSKDYIKFDVQVLQSIIDQIFDGTAMSEHFKLLKA